MARLEIHFYFSDFNGESMSVKIDHGTDSQVIENKTKMFVYTSEIALPTTLKIKTFGKNMDTDTIVDSSGRITKDKFVSIKKVLIDGVHLSPRAIKKFFLVKAAHADVTTDPKYIGFNGDIDVEFDKSEVYFQVMKMERLAQYV